MLVETSRFRLRDFAESDRGAFVAYQTDPRYRRLYDIGDSGERRAQELFDLFLSWRTAAPRLDWQLGVFERGTGRLCGSAGLRRTGAGEGAAAFGIELTPDDWGRYRLAIEVTGALLEHGFRELGLRAVFGESASGNRRVERIARWFGAEVVARRDGPGWMSARGWSAVEWALTRDAWAESAARRAAHAR